MDTEPKEIMDEYLLKEYEHIADAHFNVSQTISSFFKYYLILMAIPLSITSYLISPSGSKDSNYILTKNLSVIIASAYGTLGLIGILLCVYVINMRLDAILYARTINGIRRYFYSKSEIKIFEKSRIKVLPDTTIFPRYYEARIFLPVVLTFAVINSVYVLISSLTIINFIFYDIINGKIQEILFNVYFTPIAIFISLLLIHYTIYREMAGHREYAYLKSNIIGIDVDGVLNKHRDHFCKILKKNTGIDINPDDICHIPVHEGLDNVTRNHELAVFNDPSYWISMPPREEIAQNIKKLKNALDFKIFVFTSRPWPDLSKLDDEEVNKSLTDWRNQVAKGFTNKNKLLRYSINLIPRKYLISLLTKNWLMSNNILYDKLVIEKGNENVLDKRGRLYNRFHISGKKKIRYFIEDDLEKAVKLTYLCDAVFLIDHPYNRNFGEIEPPSNLIRVNDWNEIYKRIRMYV